MALNLKVSEINFLFSLNKLEFSFDFAIFFSIRRIKFCDQDSKPELEIKKKIKFFMQASLSIFSKSTHINELI